MKIRLDFVTNSSSSSFLLARKNDGKISQKGRDRLVDILINRFLSSCDNFDENVTLENIDTHEDFDGREKHVVKSAKSALNEGLEIVQGYVSWEEAESSYARLLEEVFDVLRDEENYRVIDDDLSY